MSEPDPTLAGLTLSHAPIGIMMVRDRRIVWVNAVLAQTLRTSCEKLAGLDIESATATGLAALFEEQSPRLELTLPDGTVQRLQRLRQPLAETGVEAHYFVDITEQFAAENELRQLREHVKMLDTRDSETGLLNRNAILQALDGQITRSRRYGNPLSAIKLNLTPPAHIEAHHLTLIKISQEFKMQLRWADLIGRLDKTDFLLVLPETTLKDAESLAQKLGHDRIALASRAEGWTVAFAVADWRKGDDARRLLKRLTQSEHTVNS